MLLSDLPVTKPPISPTPSFDSRYFVAQIALHQFGYFFSFQVLGNLTMPIDTTLDIKHYLLIERLLS